MTKIILEIDFSDTEDRLVNMGAGVDLVQRLHHRRVGYKDVLRYMKPMKGLIAGTITIGKRPDLGMLGYKEQYEALKDIVKRKLKYHVPYKYICFPELDKRGTVHFHLVIKGMEFGKWCSLMRGIGSRNAHRDSFLPVKDVEKYFTYIVKDVYKYGLAPFHNIKKSDVLLIKIESDSE